jgi:hypothetical protein
MKYSRIHTVCDTCLPCIIHSAVPVAVKLPNAAGINDVPSAEIPVNLTVC